MSLLHLLHLCDSLFPIGGFAYSDGLETATTVRLLRADTTDVKPATFDIHDLGDWMDVCLDEAMGRLEGPAVWQAWPAFRDADWAAIAALDEELHALLARTLYRVPAVVDRIVARDDRVESFSPALDIAAMTQQYLHSRLFRS